MQQRQGPPAEDGREPRTSTRGGHPSGARRPDRSTHRPSRRTAHARAWQVAAWTIWPLIALVFVVSIVPEVGPAWQAARGHGTRGTFTVEHEECGKSICSQYGPFVSDDGGVRFVRARLTEPDLTMRPGEQIPALYTGNAPQVFRADGSRLWLVDDPILLAAFVTLAVWGRYATLPLRRHARSRRRRREPVRPRAPSGAGRR